MFPGQTLTSVTWSTKRCFATYFKSYQRIFPKTILKLHFFFQNSLKPIINFLYSSFICSYKFTDRINYDSLLNKYFLNYKIYFRIQLYHRVIYLSNCFDFQLCSQMLSQLRLSGWFCLSKEFRGQDILFS